MDYYKQSNETQLHLLTNAIEELFPQYGLVDAQVEVLNHVNNVVFVATKAEKQLILRVHRQGLKQPAWIRSELHWLEAIRHETALRVPQPVRNQNGEFLNAIQVDGISENLHCVVFKYIEAQAYDIEATTNTQIQSIGTFLATLHQHSAQFKLPANFTRPRLDWEGLFGKRSPYQSDDEEKIFTRHQKEVLDAVAEKVRVVMDELGTGSAVFGLVHGDFIAKNILFADDEVCVIDFDDCGFGYYLYDFAPLLLQFSNSPHYEMVKELFWQAYTTTRPLPENHRNYLEAFVAGRHVASCRWIAGNLQNPAVRERAPKILQDRTQELQYFLLTGKLERRSETL